MFFCLEKLTDSHSKPNLTLPQFPTFQLWLSHPNNMGPNKYFSGHNLKPRSNELDFSNTTRNIFWKLLYIVLCCLAFVCPGFAWSTHQTFCPSTHELRKQKKSIVAQHFDATFFIPIKCLSITYNIFYPNQMSFDNIQHIATCLNMYEQGGETITTFST